MKLEHVLLQFPSMPDMIICFGSQNFVGPVVGDLCPTSVKSN